MKIEVREILIQMRDAALEVGEYLSDCDLITYQENRQLRRATERCVSIVGEAAYRLRLNKATGLDVLNLIEVERMRHVIVHGYDRMRDELVFDAAIIDCPKLISLINTLLEENP
jgi:uncharacterized protein with HEPN domain